jgi:hypothetical protein
MKPSLRLEPLLGKDRHQWRRLLPELHAVYKRLQDVGRYYERDRERF